MNISFLWSTSTIGAYHYLCHIKAAWSVVYWGQRWCCDKMDPLLLRWTAHITFSDIRGYRMFLAANRLKSGCDLTWQYTVYFLSKWFCKVPFRFSISHFVKWNYSDVTLQLSVMEKWLKHLWRLVNFLSWVKVNEMSPALHEDTVSLLSCSLFLPSLNDAVLYLDRSWIFH